QSVFSPNSLYPPHSYDPLAVFTYSSLFFFPDTATTEIYTLSLHDALPIWYIGTRPSPASTSASTSPSTIRRNPLMPVSRSRSASDRKSTRLNSSHVKISYAVFCLKKKKKKRKVMRTEEKYKGSTIQTTNQT